MPPKRTEEMEKCADRLDRLKRLYGEERIIGVQKRLLTEPRLRDVGSVRGIYSYITEEGRRPLTGTRERESFVYVMAYLFSPEALLGRKMRKGVRKALSRCLGVRSESLISKCLAQAVSDYGNYSDFRTQTDAMHSRIDGVLHLFR